MLICQPHTLGTHPEHREPEESLGKCRIGLQKGLLEKDGGLLPWLSKALELLMVLLQLLPLLGLPLDAEQKGIC